MKHLTKIVFALFAVFILIGCVSVYSNHGDYNATASKNSDGTISYSLSGSSSEYRYSVFSDTDMPSKIYLYLDQSYKSEFNDYYVQSEFFSVLKQMLEKRGYSSVYYANAKELKNVMNDSDAAVFFVSGAIPDTIAGTSFEEWMDAGGTVYWSGPEIGRYISTQSEVKDIGTGYLNGDVNSEFDEKKAFGYTESDMFRYTKMIRDETGYGLKTDHPNSLSLSFTDGTYSTASVTKLKHGNAFIFGGNIAVTENVSQDVTDRTCCADLIIMGLTYHSVPVETGTGTLNGNVNAVTKEKISASDVTFVVFIGSPASHWGKAFRL